MTARSLVVSAVQTCSSIRRRYNRPMTNGSEANSWQWIFSGIGVFAIGVLWHYFKRRKGKLAVPTGAKSQMASIVQKGDGVIQSGQTGAGHVVNINAPVGNISVGDSQPKQPDLIQSNTRSPTLTLSQIRNDIESAPPYQQEDRKRCYVGQRIDWQTKLFSVKREDKDGNVDVTLKTEEIEHNSELCGCVVRLDHYPELKVLPRGTRIRVVGKILRVGLVTDIEDATLYIQP